MADNIQIIKLQGDVSDLKRSLSEVSDSLKKVDGNIEKTDKKVSGLNTSLMSMSDAVSLGKDLSSAFMEIGAAIVDATRSSKEFIDSLEKVGKQDIFNKETIEDVKDLNEKFDETGTSISALITAFISFASGPLGAVSDGIFYLSTLLISAKENGDIVKTGLLVAFESISAALKVAIFPLRVFSEILYQLGFVSESTRTAIYDAVDSITNYAEKTLGLNDTISKAIPTSEKLKQATDELKTSYDEYGPSSELFEKHLDTQKKKIQEISQEEKKRIESLDTLWPKEKSLLDDRAHALDEQYKKQDDMHKEEMKRKKDEYDATQRQMLLEDMVSQGQQDSFDLLSELKTEDLKTENKITSEKKKQRQENLAKTLDEAASIMNAVSNASQEVGSSLSDFYDKQAEEGKITEKQAFNRKKAIALAELAVNTASGVVGLLASAPSVSTLGIAGSVAVAALLATSGIQAGVIAAQKPPSFHTGLAPTEYTATLDKGEAVLNRRATQMLGTNAIKNLNNGNPGGGKQVIQLILNGKVLDEVISDILDEGTSKTRKKIRNIK